MKVQVPETCKNCGEKLPSEGVYVENIGGRLSVKCKNCGFNNGVSKQSLAPPPTKIPFLNDIEVHELGKELRGDVAMTTKRPFLSDDQLMDDYPGGDSGTSADYWFKGARWARDKYEARDTGYDSTVKPAQTFYVVKTHNDKYDTGEETYTSRQIKNARLFDDEDSAQAVANQYNPTARIVKVRVEEVGE